MEFSSMRPFLQGLCCSSPWNYAVFWKLKHQSQMMLVWEDGFCDVSKSRKPMGSPIEGFYMESSNKVASQIGLPVLDGLDGASSEYPIELAVTQMSSASHLVGEGVVGRAVLAGVAHWIYLDNMTTDTFLDSECPDEWLLQFAARIKTILLLPVLPYGVLQLGSVETVAEDTALVAYIIDTFEAHQKSAGHDPEYSIQQFNLVSEIMENVEDSITSDSKKDNELQKGTHVVETNECMLPLLRVQDFYNSSMRKFTQTPENVIDSWHSLGMFHAADTCQLSRENDFSVTQNTISKSLHLGENVRPFPYVVDNSEREVYGDFVNELMGFSCEESAFEQTFVGNDFSNAIFEDESNFFNLVTESDLHRAPESAGVGDLSHYAYDSSISNQNTACNLLHDRNLSYGEDISGFESVGFSFGEDETNHLLEAVVANSLGSSFDNNSEHSSLTTINMSSKGHLSSSKRTSQPKRKDMSNLSAQVSSVESKFNTNRQQKRKRNDSLNPEKVSRLSKTSKRRVSSEDNQRTKPRDRQMIQDRIKELRDLIPNSEKCSIDGLLDKTIKHMDFLRRATNQADKLRLQNLKEETDENDINKPAEATARGNQKGTSWAVELGADQQSCPIIVKDLDHPGHMLIEMLCANHDRFLEIADVIHRLQLTILKGLMEEKPDKSWARFIVQASGNFHRLDIFWPLMQLM